MIARRVYWIILVLSIAIGIYTYRIIPDRLNSEFLIFFSLVPFLMFAGSVHGLIAHLLRPEAKGGMVIYPLIMGAIYTVLLLIHILVVMPLVCPGFLDNQL